MHVLFLDNDDLLLVRGALAQKRRAIKLELAREREKASEKGDAQKSFQQQLLHCELLMARVSKIRYPLFRENRLSGAQAAGYSNAALRPFDAASFNSARQLLHLEPLREGANQP